MTVLYNSEKNLPDFFYSLSINKDFLFAVYIIDNSKLDSGTKLAISLGKKYNIHIKTCFNNSNLGVAAGNNIGIHLAREDLCEYVLLANNDIKFPKNTIKILFNNMAKNFAYACTPKINFFSNPSKIWFAGGEIKKFFVRTPHIGINKMDKGLSNKSDFIEYAPTCFMLLNIKIFKIVGLMDENYFVYWDDTDFVWRMKNKGIKILYVPSALVLHKVGQSTGGETSNFSRYYSLRNKIYFIRKNFNGFHKLLALLLALSKAIISIFQNPSISIKALYDGLKMKK